MIQIHWTDQDADWSSIVWTERADDIIRIISAWWATKAEEELYAEFLENLP